MAQTYFASIQPGLEEALLTEIRRLGGKRPRKVYGGVEFDAARKTLYAAHLQLATATRIWLRVDEFRARDAGELYRKTRRFEWERLLVGGETIHLRAYSSNSRLYHTGKIADAVIDGLRDRFLEDLPGTPALEFTDSADEEAQLLMARLDEDRCQLSLHASGPLLHRRGWRTESGEAPLRETIAAAILELIDWQPGQGLADPMCGSATIPIEAARRALNYPPGLNRSFAFQAWKNFQPARFAEIADELGRRIASEVPAPILATDRAEEVLKRARRNADRAEVGEHLSFSQSLAKDTSIPEQVSWLVTNPPYGARLDEDNALAELIGLWRGLSHPCGLAFLWPCSRRDAVYGFKEKRLTRLTSFENGGLPVDLWVAPLSESP